MIGTRLVAGTAVMILAGCVPLTRPVSSATTTVLDPARVLVRELAAPQPEHAILLVSRDTGITGSGCVVGVYVNNSRVGELKPGEQLRLYPPAGDSIVGARFPSGLCRGEAKQISVTLRPVVESKVRIGAGQGGWFIEPSAF